MRSRLGILVILFMLPAAHLAEATPNPVPVVAIRLDPPQLTVNATAAQVSAVFNGTVIVDKISIETVKVALVSSADNGLSTSVTPNSMTFENTEPQNYTCTVIVPMGTNQQQTGINVNATGSTYISYVLASCKSTLIILGPAPPGHKANATANSTTGQNNDTDGNRTSGISGGGPAGLFGLKNEQLAYSIFATILIAAAAAAAAYRRMAKKRRAVEN